MTEQPTAPDDTPDDATPDDQLPPPTDPGSIPADEGDAGHV